ncbi:MAG: hypothetical protein IJ859_12760 [Synergistaceae bacterium]|nr:hypothetical protein [Synergistaceae bacterium]
MKLKIKRKAETLSEAVVSIAVFGILLLGLTDFMSSQMKYIARLHSRDELINKAQELEANNVFESVRNKDSFKAKDAPSDIQKFESIVSFDWSNKVKVLTLIYNADKKSSDTLLFAMP